MLCPYCKEKINTLSLKCKHCHSDLTTPEAKEKIAVEKKKGRRLFYLVAILAVIGPISMIHNLQSGPSVSGSNRNSGNNSSNGVQETPNPCFSAWDGAHIRIGKIIKAQLKDPSSYEHVETRYEKAAGGYHVITKYSAKNSFGANIVGYADYMSDLGCNISHLKFEE